MDKQQEGQLASTPTSEQEINFQSSDIKNTKSAKPSEYFVQIKDSPESRRLRASERRKVLLAKLKAADLSRRAYLKEWFKIYRAPIAIIFLSVAALAIIGTIIFLLLQPKSPSTISAEAINKMSEDERTQTVSNTIIDDGAEAGMNTCDAFANALSSPAERADIYLKCANTLVPYVSDNESIASTILSYVHLAEDISPSIATAQSVSFYESRYGDPTVAEEYSKIANERMMSDTNYIDKLREEYSKGGGL